MKKAAVIQLQSSDNLNQNLEKTKSLMVQAVQSGAKMLVLPENFAFMGKHETDKFNIQEEPGHGQIQRFLSNFANRFNVWIVGGSIPLSSVDAHKVTASCLVYNPEGDAVARYDKIHLFDVTLPETTESYEESKTITPGKKRVTLATPFGTLGLGICYDLRFPEHFRALEKQGATVFVIPSAFTRTTGAAHWEVLLRARAIENQCYVLAAAQTGTHASGRETFGHSMIIDPWGKVIASLEKDEGFALATLDSTYLEKIRKSFPVLKSEIR